MEVFMSGFAAVWIATAIVFYRVMRKDLNNRSQLLGLIKEDGVFTNDQYYSLSIDVYERGINDKLKQFGWAMLTGVPAMVHSRGQMMAGVPTDVSFQMCINDLLDLSEPDQTARESLKKWVCQVNGQEYTPPVVH